MATPESTACKTGLMTVRNGVFKFVEIMILN